MANLYEMLSKQMEKGNDYLDASGNFLSSDKMRKAALKDYSAKAQGELIDPVEVPFSDYFNDYMSDYCPVASVAEDLEQIIAYAPEETEEMEG